MAVRAMVDISDLDKAEVLKALYDHSQPLGLGILHWTPAPMDIEEARTIIANGVTGFDYLHGRVMKVHIGGDEFDPWGYDRDNGEGAAQRVIDTLRDK